MSDSSCPATELLQDYLGGSLSSEQEQLIACHIDECCHCQQRLEMLSAMHLSAPLKASLPTGELLRVESFLSQVKAMTVPGTIADTATVSRLAPAILPRIAGYEILAELGRGGMGIVYKAIHQPLNRLVAVKMILSGLGSSDSDRSRFKVEAEAIARLQHPNIVQLFEVGEADGRPYLTLEYVAGGNLQQRIADRPQHPRAAAGLILTLARAVHAAHLQQVIHRDLKPGNVLLAPAIHPTTDAERDFGIPKLTDFGLAKRLDHQHSTGSHVVSGTPSYMAPEQIPEGIAPGPRQPIGPGVDIYALGAILYQLLTGRPPFLGPDWVTTLLQVVRRDPVPVRQLQPSVPRDLETICLKCLEKDPGRRYLTANDLAEDIQRFLAKEPIRARPVGPVERLLKWARRRPVAATAVGVAGLAVLSALVGLTIALAAVEAQRQAEARAASEARAREQEILKARIEADRLRALADGNLYFSQIAQTNLLWRDYDVARARLTLAACAEPFRAWEWSHLNRLCHDGLEILSLPAGYRADLVTSGSGWYAAAGTATPAPGQPAPHPVIIVWDESGNERLRTLAPTTGLPFWLRLTPSGRRLTAVFHDQQSQQRTATLTVWELPRGAAPTAAPRPVLVQSLTANWAASGNGRWAIAVPADHPQSLRIWDLEAGNVHENWPISSTVQSLALNEDGTVLAWSDTEQIQVRNLKTRQDLASWPVAEGRALTFNPTATQLAYFDRGSRSIVVRSVTQQSNVRDERLSFDPGPRRSEPELRFSPDGRTLLGLDSDSVRLWDLGEDRQTTIAHPASGVLRGIPSPDGTRVATIGDDAAVRLWPITSHRTGRMVPRVYRGHAGAVLSATFSDDGCRLITGGEDGQVIVWDLTRPQPYLPALYHEPRPGSGSAVWLLAQGLLLELDDGAVHLWDPQIGTRLQTLPLPHIPEDSRLPATAAFAATANRLAVINPGRISVTVLHLQSWIESRGDSSKLPQRLELIGHEYPITAVAIAHDGSVIVTGSAGLEQAPLRPRAVGEVCVWNGVTGELLHRLVEPGLCVCGLAVSPDGRRTAVSSGWPGWDRGHEPAPPASLRLLRTFTGALGRPLASDRQGANPLVLLQFHPLGTSLAAIAYRRPEILQVYDLQEDRKLWEIAAAAPFTGLTYHPEGRRLAASGMHGVTLFDSQTGAEALRLTSSEPETGFPGSPGHRVSFGYTGEQLACATTSRWILWEVSHDPNRERPQWRSAALRRVFHWHLRQLQRSSTPYSRAFHAEALALAPGPLSPQDLIARARVRARQSRWPEAMADYTQAGFARLTAEDWLTLAAILSQGAERTTLPWPNGGKWPRDQQSLLILAEMLLEHSHRDDVLGSRPSEARPVDPHSPERPESVFLRALAFIRQQQWKPALQVLTSSEAWLGTGPSAGSYWRLRQRVHQGLHEPAAADVARHHAEAWEIDWGPTAVPSRGVAPSQATAPAWAVYRALSALMK